MKMKKYGVVALALIGAFSLSSSASAGIIDSWDISTVVTDPAPVGGYVDASTYYSNIFTDMGLVTTFGAVTWKHGDVQPPGLKIVNGDDVTGLNCIMTTGYNPEDLSDKMCSDDIQYSKRFKLRNVLNAPLDVNYNVVSDGGDKNNYRILQKWTDGTDARWTAFTIELGFTDANGVFTPSTSGDGLGFADTRGKYLTSTTSYTAKVDVLSALYAQGLSGPADKYHPETGYFNTSERMSFGLIATEDKITSDGISPEYSNVFGEWLNAGGVPIAIFYDDDGDLGTDNILMANCADASNLVHVGSHSGDDVTGFTCNGQWVTFRSAPGLACGGAPCASAGVPQAITLDQLAPTVYTSIEHAQPYSMYMDYIEDAANLGFNMWVAVEDNDSWPTPDGFTVRYTPTAMAGPTPEVCTDGVDNDLDGLTDCDDTDDCALDPSCVAPEVEICDDGMDNDSDGAIDCSDPDCEGSAGPGGGTCGPEGGPSGNCLDGYDNDGDGTTDCADFACEPTAVCGGIEQICGDGLDNDFDGLMDCADSDCDGTAQCIPTSCADYTDRTACKADASCKWNNRTGTCGDA